MIIFKVPNLPSGMFTSRKLQLAQFDRMKHLLCNYKRVTLCVNFKISWESGSPGIYAILCRKYSTVQEILYCERNILLCKKYFSI